MSVGRYFGALLAAIVLTSVGQLLFKRGAKEPRGLTWYTGVAIVTLLFVTMLTTYSMRGVTLSTYTAWSGLTYPLTVLGSVLVLGERPTPRVWLGVIVIAAGIALFSLW